MRRRVHLSNRPGGAETANERIEEAENIGVGPPAPAEEAQARQEAPLTDALFRRVSIPVLDDAGADAEFDFVQVEPDNRPNVEELFGERGMLWPRQSPSRYNWRRHCLEGECGGQGLVARAVRLLALGNLSDALLNGVSMVPSLTLSAAIDLMYERRVVSWNLFHFD
jgi:hypothetical protein